MHHYKIALQQYCMLEVMRYMAACTAVCVFLYRLNGGTVEQVWDELLCSGMN